MRFIEGQLDHPQVIALLTEHHQDMLQHSPPESVHALDLTALKAPEVAFYTLWIDEELAGCGAIKALSETQGEIKSMRTARQHLRKGVAATMVKKLLEVAQQRGYQKVSLETGSPAAFEPARKLYQNFGFEFCKPFGDYVEDPYSVFMTLTL